MAKIDADQIYDEALAIVKRALAGERIPYDKLMAAQDIIKPIMQAIYLQRSRGDFPDIIGDTKDDAQ